MIIATRILKFRTADGVRDVALRMFAPVGQESGNWMCRYELDWPDGTRSTDAGGLNSMQALICALQMLGSELYTSAAHRAGQLSLEGWDGGYGIPIAPSLRDLLVGDDAKGV